MKVGKHRVHDAWFSICEVVEYAILMYGDRDKNYGERNIAFKWTQKHTYGNNVYVLIGVVVTWVYTCVNTYQIIYLTPNTHTLTLSVY